MKRAQPSSTQQSQLPALNQHCPASPKKPPEAKHETPSALRPLSGVQKCFDCPFLGSCLNIDFHKGPVTCKDAIAELRKLPVFEKFELVLRKGTHVLENGEIVSDDIFVFPQFVVHFSGTKNKEAHDLTKDLLVKAVVDEYAKRFRVEKLVLKQGETTLRLDQKISDIGSILCLEGVDVFEKTYSLCGEMKRGLFAGTQLLCDIVGIKEEYYAVYEGKYLFELDKVKLCDCRKGVIKFSDNEVKIRFCIGCERFTELMKASIYVKDAFRIVDERYLRLHEKEPVVRMSIGDRDLDNNERLLEKVNADAESVFILHVKCKYVFRILCDDSEPEEVRHDFDYATDIRDVRKTLSELVKDRFTIHSASGDIVKDGIIGKLYAAGLIVRKADPEFRVILPSLKKMNIAIRRSTTIAEIWKVISELEKCEYEVYVDDMPASGDDQLRSFEGETIEVRGRYRFKSCTSGNVSVVLKGDCSLYKAIERVMGESPDMYVAVVRDEEIDRKRTMAEFSCSTDSEILLKKERDMNFVCGNKSTIFRVPEAATVKDVIDMIEAKWKVVKGDLSLSIGNQQLSHTVSFYESVGCSADVTVVNGPRRHVVIDMKRNCRDQVEFAITSTVGDAVKQLRGNEKREFKLSGTRGVLRAGDKLVDVVERRECLTKEYPFLTYKFIHGTQSWSTKLDDNLTIGSARKLIIDHFGWNAEVDRVKMQQGKIELTDTCTFEGIWFDGDIQVTLLDPKYSFQVTWCDNSSPPVNRRVRLPVDTIVSKFYESILERGKYRICVKVDGLLVERTANMFENGMHKKRICVLLEHFEYHFRIGKSVETVSRRVPHSCTGAGLKEMLRYTDATKMDIVFDGNGDVVPNGNMKINVVCGKDKTVLKDDENFSGVKGDNKNQVIIVELLPETLSFKFNDRTENVECERGMKVWEAERKLCDLFKEHIEIAVPGVLVKLDTLIVLEAEKMDQPIKLSRTQQYVYRIRFNGTHYVRRFVARTSIAVVKAIVWPLLECWRVKTVYLGKVVKDSTQLGQLTYSLDYELELSETNSVTWTILNGKKNIELDLPIECDAAILVEKAGGSREEHDIKCLGNVQNGKVIYSDCKQYELCRKADPYTFSIRHHGHNGTSEVEVMIGYGDALIDVRDKIAGKIGVDRSHVCLCHNGDLKDSCNAWDFINHNKHDFPMCEIISPVTIAGHRIRGDCTVFDGVRIVGKPLMLREGSRIVDWGRLLMEVGDVVIQEEPIMSRAKVYALSTETTTRNEMFIATTTVAEVLKVIADSDDFVEEQRNVLCFGRERLNDSWRLLDIGLKTDDNGPIQLHVKAQPHSDHDIVFISNGGEHVVRGCDDRGRTLFDAAKDAFANVDNIRFFVRGIMVNGAINLEDAMVDATTRIYVNDVTTTGQKVTLPLAKSAERSAVAQMEFAEFVFINKASKEIMTIEYIEGLMVSDVIDDLAERLNRDTNDVTVIDNTRAVLLGNDMSMDTVASVAKTGTFRLCVIDRGVVIVSRLLNSLKKTYGENCEELFRRCDRDLEVFQNTVIDMNM